MKPGGEATKPIDPIGSLGRHWMKVLLVGIVSFIALFPLIKMQSKIYYETEGMIRIDPVTTSFLAGDKDSIVSDYGNYVGTVVFGIHNHEVIKAAFEKLSAELQKVFLPPKLSTEKSLDILMKSIAVERISDTHLVKVVMLGETSAGLAELVNMIINVYLTKRRKESINKNRLNLDYLEKEEASLANIITDLSAELREMAKQAGMSTFSEEFNPFSPQLGDLQEAFTRAYGTRVEKENAFSSVSKEVEQLKTISLDSEIDELVEKDQSLWNTSTKTYNDLQVIRASLYGLSMDNPERKVAESRMDKMKAQLEKLRKDVRTRITKVVYAKRDAELKKKLILVESEFGASKKTEDELRKELETIRKSAAEVSRLILLGSEKSQELIHLNEKHMVISQRIWNLQANSLAQGRISFVSHARVPLEPAGDNRKKLLFVVFIFSFGWITAICFGFDFLDKRIRSTKDLSTALGFPPAWPISNLLKGDFNRVILNCPNSTVAKAIRSLAVRLNNEREKHQAKLSIFTGIDLQSGVSGIVLNTAHAMTGICEKVLVVELNLVAPKFVQALQIPKFISGLAGLLGGRELSEVIFQDEERKIDVLPVTSQVKIKNSQIAELLKTVKAKYDFVLIDAASVLQSDLTEFIIGLADVGVLIVHGDRSLYQNVRHAAQIIDRLELPALATVLNWKRKQRFQFKIKKRGN